MKRSMKAVIAEVFSNNSKAGSKQKSSMERLEELIKDAPPPEEIDTLRIVEKKDDDTHKIWVGGAQGHVLHLTDVNNPGKTFQAPIADTVVIGRTAKETDIVLDYDRSVSARHLSICERDGRFYARDLDSSNGSLLNGVRLTEEMEIYSGSILTLGRLEMKVQIR